MSSDRTHSNAPSYLATNERASNAAAGKSSASARRYAGVCPPTVQCQAAKDVQFASGTGASASKGVRHLAGSGVSGSGGALPYLDAIQRSFGAHDVTGVRAHVGGKAATAAMAIGAEAYATGNDTAFTQQPSLHTAAHEAAHVVQQRAGVQLKGGIGEAGDRYENHADEVADLVVQGEGAEAKLSEMSGAGTPSMTQRKAVQADVGAMANTFDIFPGLGLAGTVGKAAAKAGAKAVAKIKATGIQPVLIVNSIINVIVMQKLNAPVSPAEKAKAANALAGASKADFEQIVLMLQKMGWMDDFLESVGDGSAKKVTDQMDVEYKVPAVDLTGGNKAAITTHFTNTNAAINKFNMKVTMASYWAPGNSFWEKQFGMDQKSLIGNKAGTFDEADIDKYGAKVDNLVKRFISPGNVVSFWFSDLIEDEVAYKKGRTLYGQAIREKTKSKYAKNEAVFVDLNASKTTFFHELGHILGGESAAADHVKTDDTNFMASSKSGVTREKLTQAQISAFKSSLYAKVDKVKTAPKATP